MTKRRLSLGGLKYLLPLLAILAIALTPLMALGDTAATVTINATPTYIAISNVNNTFDFGAVAAEADNSTLNTTTDWLDFTNDGTVAIDTTIVCDNWTYVAGGSSSWTYGAPAEDTGQLVYSAGTGAYDTVVDGTTPSTLIDDVAADATDYFEVGLDAPTSFTHGDEQYTTLTITASEH